MRGIKDMIPRLEILLNGNCVPAGLVKLLVPRKDLTR